ncbi:hypothetical protein MKX07_003519 [Trichoderma sp. CBMAI-0711]|uniref:Borealin N-terminal domain-containing protein n=1 Tax=Trichoderma parareesei TaxID=858221 RepID=A0A2H2Z5U7_TRIPA|nr:hypothetical protein MKX07_003519 [Trichoderma sp. CBMAI-0711]OTA00792.1 hypothetical protein A9Z42_0010780 [Trichoderma parareesei]
MAPTRPRKQASAESGSSLEKRATSSGSDAPSTPKRSPIQKKPTGITLQQKQALIENLRLEITERARRLRAQYHLQAQGLRSRIEIRLNRIPTALRKATMGDLLLKYAEQAQRAPSRPLPLPVKDLPLLPSPQKPIHQTTRAPQVGRAQKRLSNEINVDKENELQKGERPSKRARGGADAGLVRPALVLSPTSSNSRLTNFNRATSPTKSYLYKSSSPLKTAVSRPTTASSLSDKAAETRTRGVRKVTTTSNSSSSSGGATVAAAARTKRTTTVAPKGPRGKTAAARTTRRASETAESSDGSANAMPRKAAGKASGAITRKPVMSSPRKPVAAGVVKSTTRAASAVSTTTTRRTLRKRG